MGKAFVCDSCGSVHAGAPFLSYDLQRQAIGMAADVPGDFDLCRDCADEVAEAMTAAVNGGLDG